MLPARLRFCLLAAFLAATAAVRPAAATEPFPATGAPLDLMPSKPKPRPAKRKVSGAKPVARTIGPVPAMEPDTRAEPAGASVASRATPPAVHDAPAPVPTPSATEHAEAAPSAAADARLPAPAGDATPHALAPKEPGEHGPVAAEHADATPSRRPEHAPGEPVPPAAAPAPRSAAPQGVAKAITAPAPAEPADTPAHQAAAPAPADKPVVALKGPAEAEPSHPVPSPAAPVVPVTTTPASDAAPASPPSRPAPRNDTQQYCSNIAAAAADARFAWQRKQISDLEAQLKQRVAELDAKQEEVAAVLARRDAMMKKASDTVVALYTGMKPDAAAEQIAALDDDMAAALLAQLPQRKASLILNQIPADKAAKLVAVIATVAPPEKKS